MAASPGTAAARQGTLVARKPGSELRIYLDLSALDDDSCSTVHVALCCPTAAAYTAGGTYDAVEAWVCRQTAAGAVPRRCPQHWFSQFVCYAADKQPVAIASTPAQLAQILGVQEVLLCDVNTRQLLEEQPGGWPAAASSPTAAADAPAAEGTASQQPAAMDDVEAAAAAAIDDDADDEAATLAGLLQEDEEDKQEAASSTLQAEQLLEVQKPQGNWHMHACAALFVLLDVASTDSYQQQQRQTVLQAVRCGNEAGNKVFCGRHRREGRFFLTAKNGDVLASCSCLAELAPLLGVRRVRVQDEIGDLQEKLQQLAGAAALARSNSGASISRSSSAAGAAQPAGVGQKRQGHEVGLSAPGSSKVAASGAGLLGSTAAAVMPQPLPANSLTGAVLRLRLSPDQAERMRQQLLHQAQQRQQQWQQPLPYVQAGLQGQGLSLQGHVDAWKLSQLQQGHLDEQLSVTPGSCRQLPCMGINLRLGVSSLQELAAGSGPIPVDGGRRCGNEGGLKRCCKQHRGSLIMLSDQQGQQLPGAAHLDGLASMLKVSHVELLDSLSHTPLQEYTQLPPVPTWQTCADRSSLRVWLPSTSCKGCRGLDFVVALQQDTTHSIGSLLPVVTVLKCGNQAAAKLGNRFACRKHQAGLLHIVAQGAAAPFQECSNLGELAVWLGVGKVDVLCSGSSQPLELYSSLGDQPLQLSMPCMAAATGQEGFAPPTLQLNLAACWQACRTAAADCPAADADAAAAGAGDAAAGNGSSVPPTVSQEQQLQQQQQQQAALASSTAGSSNTQLLAGGNCLFELLGQAGSLLLKVEGKPVGACQKNACRAVSLLLGLPKGQSIVTSGGDYPLLAVQRCGNEAGSRTRCRAHYDAPLTLLAACAPPQAAAAPAGAAAAAQSEGRRDQPQLTVLAKVDSNAKLAQLLGLQGVVLQDKDTAEDLGDASQWSASSANGKAAKLPQAKAKDAEHAAAAAAAALAAAGMPRSLAAVLAKSAAEDGVQLSSRTWPAGGALRGRAQQQQQQAQQLHEPQQQRQQAMQVDKDAEAVAPTSNDAAAAAVDAVAAGNDSKPCGSTAPDAARVVLPDTLPRSNTQCVADISVHGCSLPGSAAVCTAPGSTPAASCTTTHGAEAPAPATATVPAGDASQAGDEVPGIGQVTTATVIKAAAAGGKSTASPAAVAPGFTTSAPAHLARLAAAFKAHV